MILESNCIIKAERRYADKTEGLGLLRHDHLRRAMQDPSRAMPGRSALEHQIEVCNRKGDFERREPVA